MSQGKKNKVFSILIYIGALILILLITTFILYRNEFHSLMSLKKVDDYGMYQMTYYGDYGFDEFLKIGAASDAEIEAFVTKRLLKGLPINLGKAVQLLAEVGVLDGDTDKLQWSVLYNLTTRDGEIFANRKTNNIVKFHLNIDK